MQKKARYIVFARKEENSMQVRLLGVQALNFTNNNGEAVAGTNIFCAFADATVNGVRTERFFLKNDISLPENTKLNDVLEISFNHKGKIESITKA